MVGIDWRGMFMPDTPLLEIVIRGTVVYLALFVMLRVVLRREGILDPPKFVPPWFANWRGLLPYFAFSSFFNALSLDSVEARFASLIELAAAQRKSDPPPSGE